MTRVHTESDIRKVCQDLVGHQGAAALTRRGAQAALKARGGASGTGPPPVAAVIPQVLAERNRARAAAARVEAAAAEGEVPERLASALARHVDEVGPMRRALLAEV